MYRCDPQWTATAFGVHGVGEYVRSCQVSCGDPRGNFVMISCRETEPDFHIEIQDDVKEECEAKFGDDVL